MEIDYSSLTEEQLSIIDDYCKNDMKKLKGVCYPIWGNKGLPSCYHDDLYDDAMKVLEESVISYNPNRKASFETFLSNNIKLSQREWYRNTHLRAKRSNLEFDTNGKIKRDENGNPFIIKNMSIDEPVSDEDNTTLKDCLSDGYNVEDDVLGNGDDEIESYLKALPVIQKNIIFLKMDGVPVEEIKQKLNLSSSEYANHMKSIMENRTIIGIKAKRTKNMKKAEGKNMNKIEVKEEIIQVMDIDTTDSYRRDNITLGSLLNDISDELSPTYINRDYISQRQPFMWSEEQINKFYTRVLNGQPIPEIIICEQVVDGQKISFLIDGLQRLSYAELFKNNIRAVKAKGAEFTHIKYKKRVTDENGGIKIIEEIVDVVGKKYEDLPEFLQKRFDSFNVTVTRFFNCTPEMIDYHIRNYNNHTAMNKVQYSSTNISNATVGNIKELSQKHPFFKNIVKTNNKNIKDGSWDEVVGRTIMATYFLDDWKREIKDIFIFLDNYSNAEQFESLRNHLDRLTEIIKDNSLKELFTTGNTYIWLAVYDKFSKLGVDDSNFVNFMKKFMDDLHKEDLDSFVNDVYKSRQNRDKSIVVGKISGLYELLCSFLHIDKEDTEEVDYIEFVKENVEDIIDGDIDVIQISANDISETLDEQSWMLSEQNYPSYFAIVGLAFRLDREEELKEWLPVYVKNNQFVRNQQKAFLHMKESFETFLQKE